MSSARWVFHFVKMFCACLETVCRGLCMNLAVDYEHKSQTTHLIVKTPELHLRCEFELHDLPCFRPCQYISIMVYLKYLTRNVVRLFIWSRVDFNKYRNGVPQYSRSTMHMALLERLDWNSFGLLMFGSCTGRWLRKLDACWTEWFRKACDNCLRTVCN